MAIYQYPLGSILSYSGPLSATNPTFTSLNSQGWEMCNGGALNRTTCADYFALVGTTWGSGDGSTRFNTPDFRGIFLRGVDPTTMLDPDGSTRHHKYTGGNTGNNVGSYQYTATKLPNTAFTISITAGHDHLVNNLPTASCKSALAAVGNTIPLWASNQVSSVDGIHSHSLSGGDQESRGPNANINYLVMTRLVSEYSENTTITTAISNIIDTIGVLSGTSCTWTWEIHSNDGVNFQTGTLLSSWRASDGTITSTYGTVSPIIGSIDVTLNTVLSASNVYFVATTTSNTWTVKAKRMVL